MNSKHHPYSPSRLETLEKCPGAFTASAPFGDEENEASKEGQFLHSIMAEEIKEYNLTSEQAEQVQKCKEMIQEQLEQLGWDGKCKEYKEIKVSIINNDGELLTEGTADYIAIYKNKALIIDWKFGYVPVSGIRNIQLMTYATGIFDKYPHINNIKACIFQPRLNSFTYDNFNRTEHYNLMLEKIDTIIKRTKTKQFTFKTGSHCKYCKAYGKTTCPASCHEIDKVKNTNLENISELPDELLTKLYEQSKMVSSNIKKIDNEFKKRVTEKGSMCGYKTKLKDGQRKVTKLTDLYDFMINEKHIDHNSFMEKASISVGFIEGILWESIKNKKELKGENMTQKLAKQQAKEILEEFTEQGLITSIIKE